MRADRTTVSPHTVVRSCLRAGVACALVAAALHAQGHVMTWGAKVTDSRWHEAAFVEVKANYLHTVARLADGSVVAWGNNWYSQCNVPALPSGLSYVQVAAGGYQSVGRRSDGSIVAWGYSYGLPALPPGLTYVEVAAGGEHKVARRSDGSVVAWGSNAYGQCNVPVLPPGLTYVAVSAGLRHSVARRSDGSVVAWGDNSFGQCNVPALPLGMTFSHVAASHHATAAIIQSGAFNTFAAGCPGSAGVTQLDAAPPRVGTTTQIAMQPLPQNAAVLVFGFSNTTSAFGPLPLDLTGIGHARLLRARVV